MSAPADLEYERVLSEVKKMNEETKKLIAETEHYNKRNQFFVATFVLGVFAAGIAFAKLFV